MNFTKWHSIIGAAGIAAVAFCTGYLIASTERSVTAPPVVEGFLWPPPPPIDHFRLTDTNGKAFDETRLNDRWTLIFFGYTHCPDICPTTLHTLKLIREKLMGHKIFDQHGQVLFVSVDAARDTPEALRAYTDHFNPDFLAATAPNDELYRLTGQFGMQIMKVSGADPNDYHFDHPASILLVDPSNRVTGVFAPPLDAADIAEQVRTIVDWGAALK